jgi:methylthioribulose-1-phosphate dehydratase
MPSTTPGPRAALAALGRRFYDRGWVLGTSGNFSLVLSRSPLRLLMTPSGAHKGRLRPRDFVVVDAAGGPRRRTGRPGTRPSAEAALHRSVVTARGAGAVLHAHSVCSTMLSERHAPEGGLALSGFEMLKGLAGVTSHTHREWVPILENDQDMTRLAAQVATMLSAHPEAHAFLLRAHGLYTWGRDLDEAERHVEILEFLFDVTVRGAEWR